MAGRYAENAEDSQTTDQTDVTTVVRIEPRGCFANSHQGHSTPDARLLPFRTGSALPISHPTTRDNARVCSQVPTSTLPVNIRGYGRGAGVGRALGDGVGLGPDCAQYCPPVSKPPKKFPPQTIIRLPVHTAVWPHRLSGALVVLVAIQLSVPGLYLPPVL